MEIIFNHMKEQWEGIHPFLWEHMDCEEFNHDQIGMINEMLFKQKKDLIEQILKDAPEEWDMRGAQDVETARRINDYNECNSQWRELLNNLNSNQKI